MTRPVGPRELPRCNLIHVTGEIDIANSAELQLRLETAVRSATKVAIDLREATFFDASGLSALLGGHRAAMGHGRSLVLVNVPEFLRRLLRITALDSVLPIATESDCRPDL
jgi:anti-sigma B factor antagonist